MDEEGGRVKAGDRARTGHEGIRRLAIRLPVLWAALVLPLAFWPPFEDAFKLPQWAVLLAAAAAGCAVLPVAAGMGVRAAPAPGLWPAGVFVGWCAVAAGAGEESRFTEIAWWAAAAVLGVLAAAGGRREASGSGRVGAALVFAGSASAAYAIVQFAGLDFAASPATGGGRPFSTMGNPDFFAAFAVAVLPLAAVGWLERPRLLPGGACVLLAAGILLSQSRGAWLGAATAAVVGVAAVRRSGVSVVPAGARLLGFAAALLAALAFFVMHDTARDRLLNVANVRHFDAAGRMFMWRASLEMIRDRPLAGAGPGSYGRLYPLRNAGLLKRHPSMPYFYTENAHSDYLQVPAEIGLVGLGLLSWLGTIFVRRAWLLFRGGDSFGLAAILGLTASQVNAGFNFPWYLLPVQAWFWLVFGALHARSLWPRFRRPWPPSVARETGLRAFVPAAAGLAAVVLAGALLVRDLRASAWLKVSGDFLAAGRWRDAYLGAEMSLAAWGAWEGRNRAAGNASRAAYQLGDLVRAENMIRLALGDFGDSPADLSHLGLVLARLGRLAEAEAACRRGIELNPHLAEAYHHLGNVAYLKGDVQEARRLWKRALEEDPALAGPRRSLDSLDR